MNFAVKWQKKDYFKGVPVRKIPPTQDSFMLHLQRAMYQPYIWKHAHIPIHNISPATEYSYEKSEDEHSRKQYENY